MAVTIPSEEPETCSPINEAVEERSIRVDEVEGVDNFVAIAEVHDVGPFVEKEENGNEIPNCSSMTKRENLQNRNVNVH